MSDRNRNIYLRAAEGDEEAERAVLARLRRRHPPSEHDLRVELCNRLMLNAQAAEGSEAARCIERAMHVRWPDWPPPKDVLTWVSQASWFEHRGPVLVSTPSGRQGVTRWSDVRASPEAVAADMYRRSLGTPPAAALERLATTATLVADAEAAIASGSPGMGAAAVRALEALVPFASRQQGRRAAIRAVVEQEEGDA